MLYLQHMATFAALVGSIGFCCLTVFAQSTASPAFEAASVRPAVTGVRSSVRGGPGTADPARITYTGVTIVNLLIRAYHTQSYQVFGSDWLSSLRYDVLATLPPESTPEQFGRMLQNLLADRFGLVLHHETREIAGFELVTGRGGPKLKPASDPGAPPAPIPDAPPKTDAMGFPQLDSPGLVFMEGVRGNAVVTRLTAKDQPMSALVELLSREFRQPILDNTGLTGKFDFKLEFAPRAPGAIAPASPDSLAESPDEAPNLITAVQQQLGLKLNPKKIPLDVLVIDRANQTPTGN